MSGLTICEHYNNGHCLKYDEDCFNQCVQKQVSEDAISREDAVNALIAHFIPQTYTGEQVEQASKLAWKIMANAPSVIPTAKEGEWIKATGVAPPEFTGRYICSNCGDYALMDMPYGSRQKLSRYCPSCRARMKGADNE